MKRIINGSIPIIFTLSLVLLLNTGGSNIYGQIVNQTNQTSQNTIEPVQQQQNNQSKQQDPKMNEKLLNYTNAAILALDNNDESAAQQNLVQIQNALINASGKQVVVIPAPAIQSDEDSE